MNIGTKIKTARKVAGLTQKELGKKLGVSAAMIAQYETGRRFPKIETIEKLAQALDITPSILYGITSAEAEEAEKAWRHIATFADHGLKLADGDFREFCELEANAHQAISNKVKQLDAYNAEEKQKKETEMLNSFRLLNDKGQTKVIEYSKDLCNNPEYRTVSDQEE